ncbi:MAG: UxaA family hydrolase [Lentisphaeria bacterium]|nr:UxaA family hydrolase [Lentisphaeria bacterium]
MEKAVAFNDVARLADPADNVAITIQRLEAGTEIARDDARYTLSHTVLEGHRFADSAIAAGARVLSWGLPFGTARRDIAPGEYLCNDLMLGSLQGRRLDLSLPESANFDDFAEPYHLDTATLNIGKQLPRLPTDRTFDGYLRANGRGVGTRNYIIVLATTSRTNAVVKRIAASIDSSHPNIDGVVPVMHTEGGSRQMPNNQDFFVRALAGFVVHPNVGAVLAVDVGDEPVNNDSLRNFLETQAYNWCSHPVAFQSAGGKSAEQVIADGRKTILTWLDDVDRTRRTPQSIANLNLSLQCGGSDAFSGISGNPLIGALAKSIVQYGGKACIAETTELIGAEPYMLSNVRDHQTARKYLEYIEEFRALASWHGQSAEGNPSGGNRLRGLYNIIVKSIGAARKKTPDMRLDYSVDYADLMAEPGYYFMHTPGNDLESIAGQVAGGGNLIFFTTGNGSITNFPFVPTVKVVTTTGRYELLENEMDINAGRYLDGIDMPTLTQGTLDESIAVAGGKRTAGERANHSQVQIWRDWMQAPGASPAAIAAGEEFDDQPLKIDTAAAADWQPWRDVPRKLGLILPNSLCSSQVAGLIAESLQDKAIGADAGVRQYVALPHTEGCGCSSGEDDIAARTLAGYLVHPYVQVGVLLEHGCEKFHNDFFESLLATRGVDPSAFGWGSIQLDGGIDAVTQKIEQWVIDRLQQGLPATAPAGCSVGLHSLEPVTDTTAEALAISAATIVAGGGTIVVTANASILASDVFCSRLGLETVQPTMAYGRTSGRAGFHIMDAPNSDDIELLSGIGAAGVQVICVVTDSELSQANPMIPTLLISTTPNTGADLHLSGDAAHDPQALLELCASCVCGDYEPRLNSSELTAFQLARGRLGCSL